MARQPPRETCSPCAPRASRPRCRSGHSAAAPLRRRSPRPSPLAPDTCTGNHSRRCDATLLRATFNVQPPNLQPLAPRAARPRHRPCPGTGAAPLRPSVAARLAPLPSHLTPVRATIRDGAMQRCYGRRSTFNLPTFNPSRRAPRAPAIDPAPVQAQRRCAPPSPLASPLSPRT